jgi:hypothetical protein
MVPVDASTRTIARRVTWAPTDPVTPIAGHAAPPPPPEPPPATGGKIMPLDCPPGCLLEHLAGRRSPTSVITDLHCDASNAPSATDISPLTGVPDSVTHVMCTPRVCGLRDDARSSITIRPPTSHPNLLIDGGSNVCGTADIGCLLDVVDIPPITISIAIEGPPSSLDECITKRGVLPLSLSDGTTYFQPCFYCANTVETIISPAAVVSSSDIFSRWTQEGFRDPTIPGSINLH